MLTHKTLKDLVGNGNAVQQECHLLIASCRTMPDKWELFLSATVFQHQLKYVVSWLYMMVALAHMEMILISAALEVKIVELTVLSILTYDY